MKLQNTEISRSVEDKRAVNKLLASYLEGAVALTSGKTKAEAKRLVAEYHKNADKQALAQSPDALAVIKDKEKALKDKTSEFGLKTKLNYASDADIPNVSDVIASGMAAVATVSLAPIVSADHSTLGATLFVATAAYMTAKAGKLMAAEISASKTPEQKKSAQDYADVKHAQLALKLLKKEIEAPVKAAEKAKYKDEVNKLFAAGYGQPSGGLVQAAILKNQKAGR